jgi:hypothetical protein
MEHGDEDRKFRRGDDKFVLSVARSVERPQAHPCLPGLGIEHASKSCRECAGRPRRLSGPRVAHKFDVDDRHEAVNVQFSRSRRLSAGTMG